MLESDFPKNFRGKVGGGTVIFYTINDVEGRLVGSYKIIKKGKQGPKDSYTSQCGDTGGLKETLREKASAAYKQWRKEGFPDLLEKKD